MALLRQYVNGNWVNTISVQASADDLNALKALMVGKIEEWDSKASGGTATSMPDALNKVRYRIGKKGIGGVRHSCAITIHHLNPSKSDDDVASLVIGAFNADWFTDEAAEYCENIYNDN